MKATLPLIVFASLALSLFSWTATAAPFLFVDAFQISYEDGYGIDDIPEDLAEYTIPKFEKENSELLLDLQRIIVAFGLFFSPESEKGYFTPEVVLTNEEFDRLPDYDQLTYPHNTIKNGRSYRIQIKMRPDQYDREKLFRTMKNAVAMAAYADFTAEDFSGGVKPAPEVDRNDSLSVAFNEADLKIRMARIKIFLGLTNYVTEIFGVIGMMGASQWLGTSTSDELERYGRIVKSNPILLGATISNLPRSAEDLTKLAILMYRTARTVLSEIDERPYSLPNWQSTRRTAGRTAFRRNTRDKEELAKAKLQERVDRAEQANSLQDIVTQFQARILAQLEAEYNVSTRDVLSMVAASRGMEPSCADIVRAETSSPTNE